ncbi:glycosyltransferase [candidate division KSB1 bacterium]|nr:glycosyltransferase [candidate division KSB1 bacterium]
MKIILIGTAYPMRGGIAHYVALLYENLKKAGHDVKIISFKRQYPDRFFPGKTQEDNSKEIIELDSLPLIDSINPFNWINVFRKIRAEKPDIIIYKYWMPFFAPCYGTIALLTRCFSKSKTCFLCDNIIPHERRFYDGLLTWWGLLSVDYFIVQSKSVRQDLLKFRPKAVFKEVPHPVYEIFKNSYSQPDAKLKLGIDAAEKVILFFGYIRAYKGLNLLIEAFPLMMQKMKMRLIVAGEFYEGREQTLDQIEKLKLGKSLILKDDYIPNEEVGIYFSAADVVVLPYISATQSGIIQIAYNYNKPVITTRVGGLHEVVRNGITGFVIPPQQPQAIAQAVIRFFEEDRKSEFSENIKTEKKKYSWERMVEAIEGFGG